LSATVESFGVGHEGCGDRGVDPHAALALLEQRQVFVEAVRRGAVRTGVLHQLDIELRARLFHSGWSNWGCQFSSNQRAAIGVRHGGDEGHVLAPAGLAAQADAVHVGGCGR
jgi:hypothetical protein